VKKVLGILLCFCTGSFSAQNSNYWLQTEGSPNVDEYLGLAADNAGNLVAAGYFTNTISFHDMTSMTSVSSGVSDVLVVKSDPQGQLIWKAMAGGMGSDRATAVACDGSGNIYITGHYYGSATFGSTTLSSVNNTQDVFIAKLSASGTFVWAKSLGGNLSEEPYSIAVDNQGNVIVTGEFQGTATFGSQTLTSMLNGSGNASFDIFIAKYDNNGNFLWVRQGSAEFDDRGLDVGTDASGNIFVCGQFSDTITFNQVHNNQVMNAVFLIKYSPSGQELWFVRGGATSSIAYALAVDNSNDVYITGDYTGNMVFYGNPNNQLFGNYTNRIFLAKFSNTGAYLWGREDASDSYLSARDIALTPGEDPCIYGEFGCRMDEYSIVAGGTGMFNSVGYKDLFTAQYDKNGNRQWMRNWGGPMNDRAHGIVFTNNNTPYTAGSFEQRISVNSAHVPFPVMPYPTGQPWVSSTNCNNSGMYYYTGSGYGFLDCFILHGVDNSCAYYDYYYRPMGGCQLDFVGGCIDNYTYNCQDTINMCSGNLTANPYAGTIGHIGPYYHFQWNTGDTMQTIPLGSSGNYSCVMTTYDGCFTTEDTVHGVLDPSPQPPTITDNLGINVNQPPLTFSINVCGGTVALTGGNLQGCTYAWSGPGIISTSGPSCVVNQSGTYYFTLTNSYGCTNYNWVVIKIDTIDHVVPKTNMPDTLEVCGPCVDYFIFDSLSNPTGQPYQCFSSLMQVVTNSSMISGIPGCQPDNLSLKICPASTGWVNLNIMYVFASTCGNDTAYFSKQVYIILHPIPQVTVALLGNNTICPNDSSLFVASFTVTPSANISYSLSANDSVWLHPFMYYSLTVTAVDTITGCSAWNQASVSTQEKTNPYIYSTPEIICPGDSVMITCQWPGAVAWQWHGPAGILPGTASVIYDSIPGYYYCVATDNDGCTMQSNTVELKQYNTPYLMGLPTTVGCAGQSVTLQVISNDTTLIQWLPPLSGGGTIRNVTSSGTYSCQVTMCGITTVCTINVTISNPTAQITALGNLVICPGDSVLLTATSGMSNYLWLPTNQLTDSIYGYAAGVYTVIVTDGNGCQASDTVKITYNPNAPPPPAAQGDSICAGSSAVLQATGGAAPLEWYSQQYSGSVIATGNTYTTAPLYQTTTFYVSVVDTAGCHSIRTPATVYIIPTSLPPAIWGDTLLCVGDTLHLFTNALSNASYSWMGPGNFSSSAQQPLLFPAQASMAGVYSLFVAGDGCTSPVVTHSVAIIGLVQPSVTGTDTVCAGDSLGLQGVTADTGIIFTWTGPGGFSASAPVVVFNPAGTANSGTYVVQSQMLGCTSQTYSVYVLVKPSPSPNASALTDYCQGDSITLYGQAMAGSASFWSGPLNFSSPLPLAVLYNVDSTHSGYYVYSSVLNGCSGKDSTAVQVHSLPVFSLGSDTTVCDEDPLVLEPAVSGSYQWNGEPGGGSYTVYNSGLIVLTVSTSYGCKYSDSVTVTIAQCSLESPNIFSPNGDGINDFFKFGLDHYTVLKFIIYDRWGVKVFENSNNENKWDGINLYSGKPCTEGTYYFIVESRNLKGAMGSDHGYLTLVR
jgi:gliding motility-associated-like protein